MNIPKMTDDEMTLLLADKIGFGDSDLQTVNRGDLVSIIRAVEAARDAQVQAALAEQEPVARMHVGGLPQFGSAAVITKLPAADALPHGDYTLYAAAQERAEPVAPRKDQRITLNWQGRVDGTVEGFEINGMLCIPDEEGVTYITREQAAEFFGFTLSATPPAPAQPSPEPSKPEQADAPSEFRLDCAGGSPCTDCPDKKQCQRGCIRQPEFISREVEQKYLSPDEQERLSKARHLLCNTPLISPPDVVAKLLATLPPASVAGDSGAGEREMFEAWMQQEYPGVNLQRRADGLYWDNAPDPFWFGWQARAALATKPQAEQPATPPAQTVQDDEPRCTCPTSGPDYCPRHAP